MKESIKFKTLHKKVDLKTFLIVILVIIILALTIVNRVSHATYTSNLNIPFVRGKINYKHPDFKMVSMQVQASSGSSTYNETNTMPSGNEYVINSSKSYCNKGFTEEKDTGVVLKTINGNHVMNNLTKNDRCYLYFDVAPLNVAGILAKYTKDNSRSGEITQGFAESTPTTVYSKDDDDGTSYVFAGVNPNNWVKIGNMYFRIIRFNGNGSMRLIYSGTGSAETSGTGTQIGTNAFNNNSDDNMYVGLQYTSGEIHGTEINSTILGDANSNNEITLHGWFNNNIKPLYGQLIDTSVGFCSDRTIIQNSYAAGYRYPPGSSSSTHTPMIKCENSSDLLKLQVGLITVDEYMLAGGTNVGSSYYNTTFWLHTSQDYWTMTPYHFGSSAYVFYALNEGYVDNDSSVSVIRGIRPVINLKSTTTFEDNNADGSSDSPYIVSGN